MVLVNTSSATVADVAYRGMRDGVGSGTETSYAGDCEAPAYMYLVGLPDPVLHQLGIPQLPRTSQHLYVRCRRCAPCLKQRGRVWRARAIAETNAAQRTWFGTLTLAPDRATQARFAAFRPVQDGINDYGDTSDHFKRMVDFVNPEITRFLKRVRKNTDAALRYLLVTEAHKSGVPHWHCLIHEYAGKAPKRDLHTAWRYGFSHFKLVDSNTRQISYVCKYLAKSAIARIRASRNYGAALPDHITERILSATRTIQHQQRCAEAARLSKEGTPQVEGDLTSHFSFSHD